MSQEQPDLLPAELVLFLGEEANRADSDDVGAAQSLAVHVAPLRGESHHQSLSSAIIAADIQRRRNIRNVGSFSHKIPGGTRL